MSEPSQPAPDEPQVLAPQKLADDLAALFGQPAAVPEPVDRAIVALARRRLAPRRAPARVMRWAAVAAAAAVLAVSTIDQLNA